MTGRLQEELQEAEGYSDVNDGQPSFYEDGDSANEPSLIEPVVTSADVVDEVHAEPRAQTGDATPHPAQQQQAAAPEVSHPAEPERDGSHAVVVAPIADDHAVATTDLMIPPIPRISVHAFCLEEKTKAIIEKTSHDRRLSKVHFNVDLGGIEAAVPYFSEAPTPNLVILEMEADSESLFEQLGALADVCDPGTKVVVCGRCNDIQIYRALIREGISEYLVTPFTNIQLLETIGNLYADPEAAPMGRIVAFVGAKGGSGSSTIAHNVSWMLANKFDEETTIVDLDLAYGTACLNFNQDPTQGLADALTAPERLDDVLLDRLLIRSGPKLNIFSAPSSLDREYDIAPHAFETVLDTVRKSVPNVVVDLPNMWSPWSKSVLLSADQIVIVAAPDLASLRNTMNLYEVFKNARPNDPLPLLVLNKTGLAKKLEITERDFTEALHREPSLNIPFDAELFGRASNNGQMIGEIDKRGDLSAKFEHLTSLIAGRDVRAKKKASIMDALSLPHLSKREKRSA